MPAVIQVVDGQTIIRAGENTVEAARQVGLAEAQVALATAQADRAETQADRAENEAGLSGQAATASGNYAEVSQGAMRYFPTVADGMLASTAPQTFASDENGPLAWFNAAGDELAQPMTRAASDAMVGVDLGAFGASPDVDSSAASDANQAALDNAVAFAVAMGIETVRLPRGTYWIDANNGTTTGLKLNVPDGKSVRFVGETGAIIKRRATATMASTSALVFITGNEGISVSFHNIVFDGNEANCTIDANQNMFVGDGTTTAYSYAGSVTPSVATIDAEGRYTFLKSGTDYNTTGSAGAFTVTLTSPSVLGTNYIIYYLYLHEQSANIKWLPGSGTPNFIGFFNCDVGKNRVGDGYHANITVDYFMAIGCRTTDPAVRRVRADWQFSRYATYETMMGDIICNSWESEPALTQATARLFLNNVYSASVFDLAGDVTGAPARMVQLHATNVRCDGDPYRAGLPAVNFWRIKGEFTNSHFRLTRRVQRCKLTFRGGSITVADAGGGVADTIQIWHDQIAETDPYEDYEDRLGNYCVFDGVRFLKDASVTSGDLISTETAVLQANTANQIAAGAPLVRTAIINCDVPEQLDHVIRASRAGDLEIRGGSLRATVAICEFFNNGDNINRLTIEGNEQWSAPAWISLPGAIGVTTGATELNVSGSFDAAATQLVSTASIVSAPTVKWRVDAVAHVEANPSGTLKAVPGLVAKVRKPKRGAPFSYRASYTGTTADYETGYGGTVWAMLDYAPAKGATADRPTLAASDVGVQYFDTTLDADGKPIWWAGAAWVDATGAAA